MPKFNNPFQPVRILITHDHSHEKNDKFRDDVNDDLDDILHAHKVLPFSGVHPDKRGALPSSLKIWG